MNEFKQVRREKGGEDLFHKEIGNQRNNNRLKKRDSIYCTVGWGHTDYSRRDRYTCQSSQLSSPITRLQKSSFIQSYNQSSARASKTKPLTITEVS